MIDTLEYTTAEQKKIIILYRAVHDYSGPRQDTIRYLVPRVQHVVTDGHEFQSAVFWWQRLDDKKRSQLELEYMFAAK